jgi:hypothetical protein
MPQKFIITAVIIPDDISNILIYLIVLQDSP